MQYDVIVIGGGAAGLFCAIEAGKRGRRVALLEHNDRLGRKILISGGGRCNFTNLYATPEHFVSSNPKFCISALSRYTPRDVIALLERHRIRYYEKKLGQLFCVDSASQIVQLLETLCRQVQVDIHLNSRIQSIEKHDRFRVVTQTGGLESDSLVVATGGISVPKVGATDLGYRIASQFGLPVVPPRPGLAPLRFTPDDRHWSELRGISLDTVVSFQNVNFRENLLFSHQGLSGPAILQISLYWREGETLSIDLLPDRSANDLLRRDRAQKCLLSTWLNRFWPARFAKKWCDQYDWNNPLNRFTPKEIETVAATIHHWPMRFDETAGFAKAEVTAGGVDTRCLSAKTMECQNVPGLYFIGEVVDVTGQLGGFNFQWAWSSGFCAGQYA